MNFQQMVALLKLGYKFYHPGREKEGDILIEFNLEEDMVMCVDIKFNWSDPIFLTSEILNYENYQICK